MNINTKPIKWACGINLALQIIDRNYAYILGIVLTARANLKKCSTARRRNLI